MHFHIHDRIPFGNICQPQVIQEDRQSQVHFTAHPHGGPEALWFCFRLEIVSAATARHEVQLVLHYPDTLLGGNKPASCWPVYRVNSGEWQRLGEGEESVSEDGLPIWHWNLVCQGNEKNIDFALCYPYGPDQISDLLQTCAGTWKASTIGVSQAGRPITRLYNKTETKKKQQAGIYIVTRQHSGETPGSWVLDGFLRYFADSDEEAPLIWAIPFANVDGVIQGDYGKDNFPYDVNRAWTQPPMRFETHVMMRDMQRWASRCRPALGLDLHAPGWSDNRGVFAFDPTREESRALKPEVNNLAKKCENSLGVEFASESFLRMANYPSRWETPWAMQYMMQQYQIPALSIETPYSMIGDRVLTICDYHEIGKRLALAIEEFLGA